MNDDRKIVAIGLLTQGDIDRLSDGFKRMFPLEDADDFQSLIKAIDRADIARGTSQRMAPEGSGK